MAPRVLIIDDESSICISLALALEPDYQVSWENDPIRALDQLQTESFDLILLDMIIGAHNGLDILVEIKKLAPRIQVIMMTAYGSIRSSVSAMTRGAFTYLTKPLDLDELKIYMGQAVEFQTLNDNVTYLNARLQEKEQAEEMIGTSPAYRQVVRMIEKFRAVDASVLITGESGTGKSLAARALHDSERRGRFVTVNCADNAERLEEELFGCKAGARPGLTCDRQGKLDYANGGTLYLDGIGDLPQGIQGKLLHALQERSFSPVGSREVRHFNARIIASTNWDPRALIEEGRVRQDLLYRLNTVELHMPPLRERREDIPLLCTHFIRSSSTLQSKLCRVSGITEEALEILYAHSFPGNIRELANTIEYAGIVADGEWIRAKDLPYQFSNSAPGADAAERFLAGKTLQEVEKMAIMTSYHLNGGKRNVMAAQLGISPRGLWNKLKEYGLQ